MKIAHMLALLAMSVLLQAVTPGSSSAQPTMDSLWPNTDGIRWDYVFHVHDHGGLVDFTSPAVLKLQGTTTTPGGPAQNLIAEHDPVPGLAATTGPDLPPILRAIWRARPDLRSAIEERYAGTGKDGVWWPLFLHGGYFMKTAVDIQMWQDIWLHPTWIYLQDDLTVGHSFVHQLVPELADDIYLHGTVEAVGTSVTTLAGIFDNAVKMAYFIDMGTSIATDETGNVIMEFHSETHGHVHYVPDVGPVDMLEEFIPYVWVDCFEEECPQEILDLIGVVTQTQTLSLTQLPVDRVDASWGTVKALYR